MTETRNFIASAAVIALTFGIGGHLLGPGEESVREQPLSTGDIMIVENDAAPNAVESEDNAEDSAKMGKEEGTQTGETGETPESDTAKVDQPERDPDTGETAPQ
jgi:hypothetical protein